MRDQRIGVKSKNRLTWAIKPVTRIKDSKKRYDRKKLKKQLTVED